MIVVTEHGRYRVEGEGPVYLTVLARDNHPLWGNSSDPPGHRKQLDRIRVRVGLHFTWDRLTRQQIADDDARDAGGYRSNRILAILPDEAT